MTYTNKTCAIYWLGVKHTPTVIIAIKSKPSAVICSFQDFEQKNPSRQKFYFVSIHDKQQTCSFLLGGPLLLVPPQYISLGGPDPLNPSGNGRACSGDPPPPIEMPPNTNDEQANIFISFGFF